jgi:hypothetical protein
VTPYGRNSEGWRVFLAAHGPFPHDCCFCGEQVEPWSGHDGRSPVVHHVDGDHFNNVLENLASAHAGCHTGHHKTGMTFTPEALEKMAAAKRGTPLTPQHCANVSAALKGRPKSPEHVEKVRQALVGRPLSPEHRAKMSADRKGKPWSAARRAAQDRRAAG